MHILSSQDTLEKTEILIKKHDAFEKAAAAQEERFIALQQLTSVCLKTLLFEI